MSHETGSRWLLIKAFGCGFWGEVYHVASNLLLAELTSRIPSVQWGSDCLYDDYDRFFQTGYLVRPEELPLTESVFPKKWILNIIECGINRFEGNDSRVGVQYLFNRQEAIVVSDFLSPINTIVPWIGADSEFYGMSEDELVAKMFQKHMKPRYYIVCAAEEFYDSHMRGKTWLAVHVRGSDKVHEFPGLEEFNESYYPYINNIIESDQSVNIFLLTDSVLVVSEYKRHYGDRVLFTDATRTSKDVGVHHARMGADGFTIGMEVFVDVLLAVKCEFFVGNKFSTVSAAISNMKNWEKGALFLLGQSYRLEGGHLYQKPGNIDMTPHTRNKDDVAGEQNMQKQVVVERLRNFAVTRFQEGAPQSDVERDLIQQGVQVDVAKILASQALASLPPQDCNNGRLSPKNFFEMVLSLDASNDLPALQNLFQKRQHDPSAMVFCLWQLCMTRQLRPAYRLARFLSNLGITDSATEMALSAGSLFYSNYEGERHDLKKLRSVSGVLSPEQHAKFYKVVVAPMIHHLLDTTIGSPNQDTQVPYVFEILRAADSRFRAMFDFDAPVPRLSMSEMRQRGRAQAKLITYALPPTGNGTPAASCPGNRRMGLAY